MADPAGRGDLVVRPATGSDVSRLLAFWAVAGENASRPPDGPEPVARLIAHDPEAVLVGQVDGELAATIVCGWDGWRANLYRLAVAPRHRGRGLGRQMLDHAERRARMLGAERLCAMVLDGNESGTAFWRSVGYLPQEDWSRWVKPLR